MALSGWQGNMVASSLAESITVVFLLVLAACTPTMQTVDGPVSYIIEENLAAGSLIGNIVNEYKLDQKYTPAVLHNLRYSYLIQPDIHLFDLDERTGNLSAATSVDRELICPKQSLCKISLNVAVKPIQYFEAIKVFITILDINDNAPAFPQETMTSSLPESTVAGIIFPIPTATDNDSPAFSVKRYEFLSDTDEFELQMKNSTDGTVDLYLALKLQLDYEMNKQHKMKVIAWDGGTPSRTGVISINIEVLDINDNSPQFLRESYEAKVPEDMIPYTTIIKVQARDQDSGLNAMIQYSFTARTLRSFGSIFGIDHRSGAIYIKRSLDYEDTTSYYLGVAAEDRGVDSLPVFTEVSIDVVDVNDNSPKINIRSVTGSESADVPENESIPYFVAHVSVHDSDDGNNGQFNCYLDNNNAYFQLVQLHDTDFKVMTIAVLDSETHALHDILIECADMGKPPRITVAHLVVNVVNANEYTETNGSKNSSVSDIRIIAVICGVSGVVVASLLVTIVVLRRREYKQDNPNFDDEMRSGSEPKEGHHYVHPHKGYKSPVGGGPSTSRNPDSRFTDWVNNEGWNQRKIGNVYKVDNKYAFE